MRHFLMSSPSSIGKNTISGIRDALFSCDVPKSTDQSGDFGCRSLLGEIVQRDVFPLGDHKNMRRGLWADVVERQDMLVLVNFLAGDFAAQDTSKDIAAVVGHDLPPQNWATGSPARAFHRYRRCLLAARAPLQHPLEIFRRRPTARVDDRADRRSRRQARPGFLRRLRSPPRPLLRRASARFWRDRGRTAEPYRNSADQRRGATE